MEFTSGEERRVILMKKRSIELGSAGGVVSRSGLVIVVIRCD